jgi:hypothetical protein
MTTGPRKKTKGQPGRDRLRASHADRDQAIGRLKAAFILGRLTKDELEARAGRAFSARTFADLAKLTNDLPAEPPAAQPSQPVPTRRPVHPSIKVGAGLIALVMVVFIVLTVLAGLPVSAATVVPVVLVVVLGVPAAAVVTVPIVVALKFEARRRRNRSRGQLPPRRTPGPRGQAPGPATASQPPPIDRGHPTAEARKIGARPALNPR